MKIEDCTKKQAINSWTLLQKVHQVIHRELQKNFFDKGITPAQFEVLLELNRFKVLPMCRISELMAVTGGNITGLIDRLEKKDLVVRERSDKDRRVIYSRITEEGEKLFQKVFGEFEQNLLCILSALEDSELEKFEEILLKLFAGLSERYGVHEHEPILV